MRFRYILIIWNLEFGNGNFLRVETPGLGKVLCSIRQHGNDISMVRQIFAGLHLSANSTNSFKTRIIDKENSILGILLIWKQLNIGNNNLHDKCNIYI